MLEIMLSPKVDTRFLTCIPCFFDAITNTVLKIAIPDEMLTGLSWVKVKSRVDLLSIPSDAGNYWIVTNEPIKHCLNGGKPPSLILPDKSIIYNGVADGLRNRAASHLLREDAKGGFGTMSGISIDVMKDERSTTSSSSTSHAKCLWGTKKKLPKILCDGVYKKPVNKNEIIDNMFLSELEKEITSSREELYFKNGICVTDLKHEPYDWFFVFAPMPIHNIRDYVENQWRLVHGVPVLCSYTTGR